MALPGGQLVLLLARRGPGVEGQLRDGRHVRDEAVQLLQVSPDQQQLPRTRGQVVPVATSRLTAGETHGGSHTSTCVARVVTVPAYVANFKRHFNAINQTTISR